MRFRRHLSHSLLLLLTMATWAALSWGQSGSTGALTGTVSDPTGAVIPGVTVTATNSGTNQARSAVTADDGVYRIPLLDPGIYRVSFSLPGFKTCAPRMIAIDGLATSWGTTGIGIVRGPGQANTDISVTKMTRIGERQSVQFRAEFFNAFNHAQFAMPSTIGSTSLRVDNPNFGLITATSVNPRIVQLALRYQF